MADTENQRPGIVQRTLDKGGRLATAATIAASSVLPIACNTSQGPQGTYRGPDNCVPPTARFENPKNESEAALYDATVASPEMGLAMLHGRFNKPIAELGNQSLDQWLAIAPFTPGDWDSFKAMPIIETAQAHAGDKAAAAEHTQTLRNNLNTLIETLQGYDPIPGKGPDYSGAILPVQQLRRDVEVVLTGIADAREPQRGAAR